ncbi:MAG: TolC family protein [Fidelibacterota bacterium]|nr:MAG: TolC family protein [Candidatus Neomarinimicrobiota bacterium]
MKILYCLFSTAVLGAGLVYAQSTPALTLDQLIDIGLDNNSDVLIAERNLGAARAEKRGAYSGLVPYLSTSLRQDMDPGKSYINPLTGSLVEPPVYGSAFSVNQTIFDGVASWYDARSGAIAYESAEAALEGTHLQVVLNIKEAYYNLLSAVELMEVAQEALELSRRQLELVEERFRLQAVKETDLMKARVSTGQREAEVHQAQQNVRMAVTSLQMAIGQEPSSTLNVARDSVSLQLVPDRAIALEAMMTNSPGLRAQKLAVDRARLNAKKQRGAMLPSINLSYSVNTSGSVIGDLYQDSESSTFLSLSVPVFTGLRNTSLYSRLRYAALAEEERLSGLEREYKQQLENTLSNLNSLHKIYPINQEVLASAEADARLANEQYNLGAISILDLLDAQVSLITARSTLVRTTYDIKIAEARLDALMGTISQ